MEAIMVGSRTREIVGVSEEVKSRRRAMKRQAAIEGAKAKLLSHMATLAQPTLKPNKAVDAADKRRLLGEPEFPPAAHEAIAVELKAVRGAASAQLSAATLSANASHEMAGLAMRAAAGALWAGAASANRHAASEAKRRPPLPPGTKPLDAVMANDLELPGRRRLRASLTALCAAASAYARAAELGACGLPAPLGLLAGDDTGGNGAASACAPGAAAALPASSSSPVKRVRGPEYKTLEEACEKLKLFPPARSLLTAPAHEAAAARTGYDAFVAAVQAHADARCNLEAKKTVRASRPHALRPPQPPPTHGGAATGGAGTALVTVAAGAPAATEAEAIEASNLQAYCGMLQRTIALWPAQRQVALPSDLTNAIKMDGAVPHNFRDSLKGEATSELAYAAADSIQQLLRAPPDTLAADAITEERIRAFAKQCGVDIGAPPAAHASLAGALVAADAPRVGADKCHVLPLIMLAMQSPLPPGWECRAADADASGAAAPEAAAGAEYVHVASGTAQAEHPLLPTIRRMVQGEVKRGSGRAHAALTSHEWVRVAELVPTSAARRAHPNSAAGAGGGSAPPTPTAPKGGSSKAGGGAGGGAGAAAAAGGGGHLELRPVWVNMVTGQRCREFPALGSEGRDAIYRRSNGWSDKQAKVKAFYEGTSLRQTIGDLPSLAVLRTRSESARGRALARRPLTMLEVVYAAEAMGIDPVETPELAFLAEEALCLELPLGWERIELPESNVDVGFYKSSLLRLSQWQHPKLTYLIALAKALTAADAAPLDGGEE